MTLRTTSLAAVLLFSTGTAGAQPTPQDAHRLFSAVESLVEQDNSSLWGRSLAGPVMMVDPESRIAFSNAPAPGFAPAGDIWRGALPDSVAIANTAFAFGAVYRTMVMWPLPEDDVALRRLAAHELWHRIQSELGFPMTGPANEHLGTRDGRYLLRLEMRALAKALHHPDQDEPLQDALGFRAQRHALFAAAAAEEQELILHEGIAQYTGFVLSGESPQEARAQAASALGIAENATSFVRSFAYSLGPAYGLLLDVRSPGWTRSASASMDLADMLSLPPVNKHIVDDYDSIVLAAEEDAREVERVRMLEVQLERYVTGSILVLEFDNMQVSFDPGQVDVLAGHGLIYQSLRLTDTWGTLTVTGGALIRSDWSAVVVPAPPADQVVGAGYELELSEGWELVNDGGVVTARRARNE